MATRDRAGKVTETPREATQAENSKNSFNVLKVSMILAVVAAIALFWYFGVIPGLESSPQPMPR
jgi:hypothetical protein